jgi:hypothetical protein
VAITNVTGFSEPFVQTHPFYDKTYVAVYKRTANNGAGTGSSAVGQVVTQLRLSKLTDFSFPYRFGGAYYLGFAKVTCTATGSGAGTQTAAGFKSKTSVATGSGAGTGTANWSRIPSRTATGSGIGTSTTASLKVAIRTATGSGTGTSSVVRLRTLVRVGSASAGTGSSAISQVLSNRRTATGSGVGSSSVTTLVKRLRSASGDGLGSSSVIGILVAIRTATGSGVGTGSGDGSRQHIRIATGSGVGTQSDGGWNKSHIFRVPYTKTYPGGYFGANDAANRLQRYNRTNIRVRNLYKLTSGDYTTVDQRDQGQVAKLWQGGHDHYLTDAEVVELTAAGFGASIT